MMKNKIDFISHKDSSCLSGEQKPVDTELLLLSKRSKRKKTDIMTFNRQVGRIKRLFSTLYPEMNFIITGKEVSAIESYLRKRIVHEGLPGYVSTSKLLFEWTFQHFGEATIVAPTYYIAVTQKNKHPKVLSRYASMIRKSTNKRVLIQLLLSILAVYRSFNGSGKMDTSVLKVITDDNCEVNKKLQSDIYIRKQVELASHSYISRYDSSDGLAVLRGPSLFTSSAGPSSRRGELPLGEFPVFKDGQMVREMVTTRLSALHCAESEAFALHSDKQQYDAWVNWCEVTDQTDLVALMHESLRMYRDDKSTYPVNKIGFKADKGLKNRPYAMVNYWIQLSLGGIHTWAYSLLRQDKSNFCFDHREAFIKATSRIDNSTLLGCLDETAATDKFALEPFNWFLSVRFGSKVANAWTSLMRILKFYVPRYTPIRWGCGQPLGTKGSWPLYNVVSSVVDLAPMLHESGRILPVELRVGDDTVFVGKHWIRTISEWRENFFGVSFGKGKGIISKTALEFCKQYYTKYGEVTPISANLLDKAFSDSACYGMLVKRIHETMGVPYESVVFEQLAALTSSFWSYKKAKLQKPLSYETNRLAILEFYRLPQDEYKRACRLLALSSLKDAVAEVQDFRSVDATFASRVIKSARAKSISSLRVKVQDILTDPNPNLDWSSLRRLSSFRPQWLKPKVIERRGLHKLVNFITISDQEYNEVVEQLTQSIYDSTGY